MIEVKGIFNDKDISIETGKVARQCSGSVVVKHGDNTILATVNYEKSIGEEMDFFPLTVDFIEKSYAAGKIPGGFLKREARPSIDATLVARVIDRPLRPLFPKAFKQRTSVVITVLSYDGETSPDTLGMLGASAAISISELPFAGPIAGVTVGKIGDDYIINPTKTQLEESEIELVVAGTTDNIMMIEAGAKEVSEDIMVKAILFGHEKLRELITLQEELIAKINPVKIVVEAKELDETIYSGIKADFGSKIKDALYTVAKQGRDEAVKAVKDEAVAKFVVEDESNLKEVKTIFEKVVKEVARATVLAENKRVDGRGLEDIRTITCETDVLPIVHGSSLFTRGETQSLGVVTLGTKSDEKMVDGLDETYFKDYYLHYNFPPYSVGEAGPMRSPGRRELGHGHLAERSLKPILPIKDDFPYTIRIVSEITESNGSSSMASVCSGSMSLMAAGVPTKASVSGIAMGLIKEGEEFAILSDIMGLEDHLGDMDFKVAGTKQGITALQMDIKISGITEEIMTKALAQANTGRLFILGEMDKVISNPNNDLAPTAPRIETLKIDTEKISTLIGPGGKMVKQIIADFEVQVDISDDGTVNIFSNDGEKMEAAKAFISSVVEDVVEGKVYPGKVVKIMNFGAFIEIPGGAQGLCHISEIENHRIEKVEDYLKEGQEVNVKCLGVDERSGKVSFSIKALKDS